MNEQEYTTYLKLVAMLRELTESNCITSNVAGDPGECIYCKATWYNKHNDGCLITRANTLLDEVEL